MDGGIPWWSSIVATVAGALVGAFIVFWLGRSKDEATRASRLKSCWSAVRAELEICGTMGIRYLTPPHTIMAPAYRWPTVAREKVLPELLLLAGLNTDDTRDLLGYFIEVDALNRGLDMAQDAHSRGEDETLRQLFERNRNRIELHVRTGGDGYAAALSVIRRHTTD
jgi:hypothetical protein